MKTSRYRIDLMRQMADCDANFIRLLKLMPTLESFRQSCFEAGQAVLSSSHAEPSMTRQYECDESPAGCANEQLSYAREFLIQSAAADAVRIRISVLEVFRYTSTLAISQLTRVSEWIEPPVILVRVYHDASTAEAVAYQGHKAFLAKYAIPNPAMYHQDEKRQINEFLGEWLSLCVQAGHSQKIPTFICAA